jgi:two-component system chemotaxis response regulator CheB
MLLDRNGIHLSHGPKENRARPAINPLFRSAASSYDGRVAGVILTGTLDDGVSGLAEVKRQGGVAIVEDPLTAQFPSMPENAIARVEVNHVVPATEIAGVLSRLAISEREHAKKEEPLEKKASGLTCPECRGPLWEEHQGKIVEYACRVGHRYTPLAMECEHHHTVERSLWSSVVALEEAADILEKITSELGPRSYEEACLKREQAAALREMLNRMPEMGENSGW